jgi:serine/threonine protein kinase
MHDSPLVDGRFLLLDSLGRGGMATVYRAFDRLDERMVALKVQREAAPPGPSHPLAAEYDAWARLDHPNVVAALELAFTRTGPFGAGAPYLVLENVEGGTLGRAVPRGGVDGATLETLAADLLRALDHVHAAGLVHRDLKPTNVLVDRSAPVRPRFKLTDFGLAIPTGSPRTPGTVSGSLPYLAPETILGLPLDGRADLYGLGMLLLQAATGELPCPGGNAEDVVRWHLSGAAANLERVGSPGVKRSIARLISRDRRFRPRSAAEALTDLGIAVSSPGVSPRTYDRGERARLRLALDATRLGARHVVTLPAEPGVRDTLLRQVRFWSNVHGLELHDLESGVVRLILRLLVDPRVDARAFARRRALERWLPLTTVGEIALLDRARLPSQPSPGAARAVAAFVLDCSVERGLVLLAPDPLAPEPWVGAVTRELMRASVPGAGPRPAGGGLLLLVRRAARAALRAARDRRSSAGLPLGPVA